MADRDRSLRTERQRRIAMVIDQLEAGGAQRQFCLLAQSLQKVYEVEVFTLRKDSFFRHLLTDKVAIPINAITARSRPALFVRLRVAIRRYGPAIVLSFLSWPNLLVELAGIPSRKFAILVSERNTDIALPSIKKRVRYLCHRFADHIVSNSYSQARVIAQNAPALSRRTTVITNAVDTEYFVPPQKHRLVRANRLTMLILARPVPQKNLMRMIRAAAILRSHYPAIELEIDWYGKAPTVAHDLTSAWTRASSRHALRYLRTAQSSIAKYTLQDRFRIHPPVPDVRTLYASADVVCLPSIYEGYSNVVAEALACGVPVLASRVGDNSIMVTNGFNGFLFDPQEISDIVSAIIQFASLSYSARRQFSQAARLTAESLSSVDSYTASYTTLIDRLTGARTQ